VQNQEEKPTVRRTEEGRTLKEEVQTRKTKDQASKARMHVEKHNVSPYVS
jgi:hypothetical protein